MRISVQSIIDWLAEDCDSNTVRNFADKISSIAPQGAVNSEDEKFQMFLNDFIKSYENGNEYETIKNILQPYCNDKAICEESNPSPKEIEFIFKVFGEDDELEELSNNIDDYCNSNFIDSLILDLDIPQDIHINIEDDKLEIRLLINLPHKDALIYAEEIATRVLNTYGPDDIELTYELTEEFLGASDAVIADSKAKGLYTESEKGIKAKYDKFCKDMEVDADDYDEVLWSLDELEGQFGDEEGIYEELREYIYNDLMNSSKEEKLDEKSEYKSESDLNGTELACISNLADVFKEQNIDPKTEDAEKLKDIIYSNVNMANNGNAEPEFEGEEFYQEEANAEKVYNEILKKYSRITESESVEGMKKIADKQMPKEGYRYITTHGVGPGTLPDDVQLIKSEDVNKNGRIAIYVSRPLTAEELKKYDIKDEWIQESFDEAKDNLNENNEGGSEYDDALKNLVTYRKKIKELTNSTNMIAQKILNAGQEMLNICKDVAEETKEWEGAEGQSLIKALASDKNFKEYSSIVELNKPYRVIMTDNRAALDKRRKEPIRPITPDEWTKIKDEIITDCKKIGIEVEIVNTDFDGFGIRPLSIGIGNIMNISESVKLENITESAQESENDEISNSLDEYVFDTVEFEKQIPHTMRWKEWNIVNQGQDLYWVTQQHFTEEEEEEFSKAFSKTPFRYAYVIVRDDATYKFRIDKDSEYMHIIENNKIEESLILDNITDQGKGVIAGLNGYANRIQKASGATVTGETTNTGYSAKLKVTGKSLDKERALSEIEKINKELEPKGIEFKLDYKDNGDIEADIESLTEDAEGVMSDPYKSIELIKDTLDIKGKKMHNIVEHKLETILNQYKVSPKEALLSLIFLFNSLNGQIDDQAAVRTALIQPMKDIKNNLMKESEKLDEAEAEVEEEPKTIYNLIQDRIGEDLSVGAFNTIMQSIFGRYNEVFLLMSDFYNIDPNESHDVVIFDDEDMYTITFIIKDLVEGTIEITDVTVD